MENTNNVNDITKINNSNLLNYKQQQQSNMEQKNLKQFFVCYPSKYLNCDIREVYHLNRKFYIIYALINSNRTIFGHSYLTVSKVMECYGVDKKTVLPKIGRKFFQEVVDVVSYLETEGYIKLLDPLPEKRSPSLYDYCIQCRLLPKFLKHEEEFTKVSLNQIKIIWSAKKPYNRETIFTVFLYMLYYINFRFSRNNTESYAVRVKMPNAFFRSIENFASDLNNSKDTILQCIEFLTSSEGHKPLLIKDVVNNRIKGEHVRIGGTPNIYVLNETGYEQEIQYTRNYLSNALKANKNYNKQKKEEGWKE